MKVTLQNTLAQNKFHPEDNSPMDISRHFRNYLIMVKYESN